MLQIRWNEKYHLGIECVDEEHKQLVEVINSCFNSILHQDNVLIKASANQVIKSVHEHFASEEELMRKCSFDGLLEHMNEHQKLCLLMEDGIQQALSLKTGEEIKEFVEGMIMQFFHHIIEEDSKFLETYQQHQILSR
ncbi:hemerythrin domain-containing protein [Terasakiella sp. SH-1]|uniref:bacteriohemerythrin n=1 Tax=Terasakiella sp. SH-1 TaxID=2560057 RepID=UPI001073D7A8|nr:hemerythrin domain-containing protein [Terasakiella sp. SH-1]